MGPSDSLKLFNKTLIAYVPTNVLPEPGGPSEVDEYHTLLIDKEHTLNNGEVLDKIVLRASNWVLSMPVLYSGQAPMISTGQRSPRWDVL